MARDQAPPRAPTARRDMQAILSRGVIADGWLSAVKDAIRRVILRQARQAVLEIESGGHQFGKFAEQWESQFYEARRKLALKMAIDGYRLGEAEMGSNAAKKELAFALARGKAGADAAEDEEDLHPVDALIRRRLEPKVDDYLTRTSKLESETSVRQMDELWKARLAENATAQEIADAMLQEMPNWSDARAGPMARALTIWSYNAGAVESYKAGGIEKVE